MLFYQNMEVKEWWLCFTQSISVDNEANISFNQYRDKHNRKKGQRVSDKGITLSFWQFMDLNDIILNWEWYNGITNMPIGRNVWFNRKRHTMMQIYNNFTRRRFTFQRVSWTTYKERLHYVVSHFLNNGLHLQHRKRYARESTSQECQPRRSAYLYSTINVPQRSTAYGGNKINEWKKYSNFPKRKDTTTGCNFQFRRAADEVRASTETGADSGEDADIESTSDNFGMESDESCSVS